MSKLSEEAKKSIIIAAWAWVIAFFGFVISYFIGFKDAKIISFFGVVIGFVAIIRGIILSSKGFGQK